MAKEKKKRRPLMGVIIAVVVIILIFLSLIGFITDFLWFKELDYVSVFFTKLFTQIKIGVPVFVVITFLAYVYLKFLKRGYFKKIDSDEPVNHGRLNLISWALAAVYGIVTTFFAVTRLWFDFLQFSNSTNFDIKDPLYNLDVSFYVFRLDFIEEINQIILLLLIAFAVLTVIYYSVLLSMRTPKIFEEEPQETKAETDGGASFGAGFDNINGMFGKFTEAFMGKSSGKGFKKPSGGSKTLDNKNLKMLLSIAEKQLIVVGILFFIMLGVNFFLKQYNLLFGSTGAVFGAGFTDVNVTLWVYRIVMVLSVLAAIGFAVGIKKKKQNLQWFSL